MQEETGHTIAFKEGAPDVHPTPKIDAGFTVPSVDARYNKGEVLGQGGNAIVIRAYDRDLKRDVALKLLKTRYHRNERAVARFLNEARITSRLQHPGVIPVYEVGCIGRDDFFFSMKIVTGKTLRDFVEEDKAPSLKELLQIFNRICSTMAYVHQQGVAHRDLKPENIMLEQFDSILIMDWGIAKKTSSNDNLDDTSYDDLGENDNLDLGLTRTGEITGTPAYMSPEQTLGMMKNMDCRSDIFSLGIILYEMITGENPFMADDEDSIQTVFASIKRGIKDMPRKDFQGRNIPAELKALCMKCLEVVPANRYQNAGELFEDFSKFLSHRPVMAYRSDFLEHIGKWFRRQMLWVIVALIIAGSIGFSYFHLSRSEGQFLQHFRRQASELVLLEKDLNHLYESLPRQKAATRRVLQRRQQKLLLRQSNLHFSLVEQGVSFPKEMASLTIAEKRLLSGLFSDQLSIETNEARGLQLYETLMLLRKSTEGVVFDTVDEEALKKWQKLSGTDNL